MYQMTNYMEHGPSEKLTGPHLVNKFPAFYGFRSFITALKQPLSEARSIQSMPPSQFLKMYFNIILPSMPLSSRWPLSLRSPHQNPLYASPLSYYQ